AVTNTRTVKSNCQNCCNNEVLATDDDGGNGDNPSATNTCHGGIGAGCSGSSCYTTNQADGTDKCTGACHTGVNGCYFIEYYPTDSSDGCFGKDQCAPKDYDADTNSNTCDTCRNIAPSLKWNWGCSGGDCASSPNTCCGDDANEWAITCYCNSAACSCAGDTQSCCKNTDDCVWNNRCYLNGADTDLDSDGITEHCITGTWYAYPKITSIFTNINPVDRDKETTGTYDIIRITTGIYDQDDFDSGHVYITIYNSVGGTEINSVDMSCIDTDKNNWECFYDYNPRNDAPVGDYDVKIFARDKESLTDETISNNLFLVEDISIITNWNGNTTDLYMTGTAIYMSDSSGINSIIDQLCSHPTIPLNGDGIPANLRLCGVNSFIPSTCSVGGGNFNCYIKDIKITGKSMTISYILTDNNHISGSKDITINLDGTMDYFEIDDPDKFVNPYQNITHTLNFTNTGNIGWHGEIFNQTRVKIYAPSNKNPGGIEHVSVHYFDQDSFVNLMNGEQGQFNYFGGAHYILGDYEYTADLRYFWPEYYEDYGFTPFDYLLTQERTIYTVAAIDITDYNLPEEIFRGDQITGQVRGYFVASMDLNYWEVVQAFKYRVSNENAVGEYWVTKVNTSSWEEEMEIGERDMNWNSGTNFYEAKINTFDLTCDTNVTIHRVYYQINWTDYNIYVPYVKGEFLPEFYPYFYQDFEIKCTGRELFNIEPEIVNLPLGTKDVDIFKVIILNPSNKTVNKEVLLVPRNYPGILNWLDFEGESEDCLPISDCIKTTVSIVRSENPLDISRNSTTVHLYSASRTGHYNMDLIIKDADTGVELGRARVQLNIFSKKVGSENIFFLVLLFLVTVGLSFNKLPKFD
ncbi:MAG: hypothetical protein KAU95_00155, partial [Candidatus Aenigmarchaeota archaeon]|nr:hypothetical protein [Candidatus Aenigmarchaeota archaeon]